MNHEEPHRSSRLQFTQEERNEPALQKPIRRAEKAAGKLEDAQAKIPKRKVIVKERTVEADTGKKTARLHFVDVDRKPPSKLAASASEFTSDGDDFHSKPLSVMP